MVPFRKVQVDFWKSPNVAEEMTKDDKLFFLYVLTNAQTTPVGIYRITIREIAFDLESSMEEIRDLIERFTNDFEMIRYNEKTREMAIKKWGKYNLTSAGKPMIDCVTSALKNVKDTSLIAFVGNSIDNEAIRAVFDTYSADAEEGKWKSDVEKETVHEAEKVEAPAEEQAETDNVVDKTEENNVVQELFNHYVSKGIIVHKKLTSAMRRAIKARLKDYTYEELKSAIDNYALVYFSDNHWFTHKYPLADFMRDKDVRKFLDEADPIDNFAKKVGASFGATELRKEDFDLS